MHFAGAGNIHHELTCFVRSALIRTGNEQDVGHRRAIVEAAVVVERTVNLSNIDRSIARTHIDRNEHRTTGGGRMEIDPDFRSSGVTVSASVCPRQHTCRTMIVRPERPCFASHLLTRELRRFASGPSACLCLRCSPL